MGLDRERWKQLEPLLDRALDMSEAERVEWLGELRAKSPDLADDLGALLSSDARAIRDGFLEEPIVERPPKTRDDRPPEDRSLGA